MYYALHGMRGTSHGIPHYMHCASIATPWHFASDALYFPWYLMGRPIGLPLGWVVLPMGLSTRSQDVEIPVKTLTRCVLLRVGLPIRITYYIIP